MAAHTITNLKRKLPVAYIWAAAMEERTFIEIHTLRIPEMNKRIRLVKMGHVSQISARSKSGVPNIRVRHPKGRQEQS
jgi:hypothetical protein